MSKLEQFQQELEWTQWLIKHNQDTVAELNRENNLLVQKAIALRKRIEIEEKKNAPKSS